MDDNDIIELFWQRNQDAIVQTDLTYGPMCRALSRRILHNSEDAEECVNDSYYRLWERIPPERPQALGAYLSRIVRNVSLDRLRELVWKDLDAGMELGLRMSLESLAQRGLGVDENSMAAWQFYSNERSKQI